MLLNIFIYKSVHFVLQLFIALFPKIIVYVLDFFVVESHALKLLLVERPLTSGPWWRGLQGP